MCRMKANYVHGSHLKIYDDGRFEESKYVNDKRTDFNKHQPIKPSAKDMKQAQAFLSAKNKLKAVLDVKKELADEQVKQSDLQS